MDKKATKIENPAQLKIWNDVINNGLNSTKNNALKKYLNGTGDARAAFDYTRRNFNKVSGNKGEIHHWNYPLKDHPNIATNPDHLIVTNSSQQHDLIHARTTSNPSKPDAGPTAIKHKIPVNINPAPDPNTKILIAPPPNTSSSNK